jgi:serine phosphatase RsbU (regulator of sigma subunit)
MDILRTHPMAVVGELLESNPFFVPPDEFLRELRERRRSRMTRIDSGANPGYSQGEISELRELHSSLRDLVASSTLSAVWMGYKPPAILDGLAESVERMLRLELVYARLTGWQGQDAVEVARFNKARYLHTQPQDLGHALAPWLEAPGGRSTVEIPDLAGDGKLRLAITPLGIEGHLGVVIAGSRCADFPSNYDQLLLSVAVNQAVSLIQSSRLIEHQKYVEDALLAQEMEMAKQVQTRLFPQKLPAVVTLDCEGRCIEARTVGGDYYDFVDLGPGRVGLVLADIAGKGFSAALLMANLQANLRSQCAVALDNLPRLLESVNGLFYENSPEEAYATLFFADYDDQTRRLRYANCGHLPPLLLGADGTWERLEATSTVLGLFENWECCIAERVLAPGDLLVLYSDGVTEARNGQDQEFGQAGLLECLRAHAHLSPPALLDAIVAAVREFSVAGQEDDITVLLARCR